MICAALAQVLLARGLPVVSPTDGAKHSLLCSPLCSGGTGWDTFLPSLMLVQMAAVEVGAGLWLISVWQVYGDS